MSETEVKILEMPKYGVCGDYLINIVRIPTNPENQRDEAHIRNFGLRATREYFFRSLGDDFEIKSLDTIVSFHIGGNYADLRGKFIIKKRNGNSK